MMLDRLEQLVEDLRTHEGNIKAAIAYTNGTHTFDDIVAMIMTGRVDYFPYQTAFVIMERITYPQFSIYHCFLAGGDLQGVLDSIPPMKQEARRRDCRYLSMAGRKGWTKVLADDGWKHIATTMYTEV